MILVVCRQCGSCDAVYSYIDNDLVRAHCLTHQQHLTHSALQVLFNDQPDSYQCPACQGPKSGFVDAADENSAPAPPDEVAVGRPSPAAAPEGSSERDNSLDHASFSIAVTNSKEASDRKEIPTMPPTKAKKAHCATLPTVSRRTSCRLLPSARHEAAIIRPKQTYMNAMWCGGIQEQVFGAITTAYPHTDADWHCQNTLINSLALVCKGLVLLHFLCCAHRYMCTGWWHSVAPDETLIDRRLYRRVAITATLETTDMRAWWAVVKVTGMVQHGAIAALAAGCPGLTGVNMGGCYMLTDASILALAAGCPELTDVNVFGCGELTDASMSALAAGCPRLTTVNVSYCDILTDASILALAAGCPELTHVDVNWCCELTDASMSALATGCPRLTTVDVSYCSNLTDASIVELAAGCPELTHVAVNCSRNLTDAVKSLPFVSS